MMKLRIVFLGSPDFALPTLKSLATHFHVVGVITQPDRPAGRGQTMTSPPIKFLAQELGLVVIQPAKLRNPEAWEKLNEWAPDLLVVAAYGQILRQNVLDLPKYGCINVHASLLPRWRGASPIQAAIAAGDHETGVTIMKMDDGIDTGDILSQQKTIINPDDTAITLEKRLAGIGSELLIQTLPSYFLGEVRPIPQVAESATYASMLKKDDGDLDLTEPVAVLERKVRAFLPWPGTYISWEGGQLKISAARVLSFDKYMDIGTRSVRNKRPVIAASDGWLVLDEVTPQGKKSMRGDVFLNGARNWAQV
jgi:methionyl-tRNA formyltransferase